MLFRSGQPGNGKPATGGHSSVVQLGKLFSAFCLALLVPSACAHIVTEGDKDQSVLHYEIAVQNLVKSPQIALKEAEDALGFDPTNANAWHLKGLVLHQSFHRLDEAQSAYAKALELKNPFSDARANLGNLYMDQKRYDDAIAQYQLALSDVMYPTPFIPQGNMGWAFFKKGDSKQAIELLKNALTVNPKYCLGELSLGQIGRAHV